MAKTKVQNLLVKYENDGYCVQLLKSGAPVVAGIKQWFATIFVYNSEPGVPLSETDCKRLRSHNETAGFYDFFMEDHIYSGRISAELFGRYPGVVVVLMSKNALSRTKQLLKELEYRQKTSFDFHQESARSILLASKANKLYKDLLSLTRQTKQLHIYDGIWFEHPLWLAGNDVSTFARQELGDFVDVYAPKESEHEALQATWISAMASVNPEKV